MKKNIKLAIAQINCTVGDLDGNVKKICDYIQKARSMGAALVSFPELAITGYAPEDLLLKSGFVEDNITALKKVVKTVGDIIVVVGFVDGKAKEIYNAAAVIYKGEIKGIYRKAFLPNFGVFDEQRYFKPGNDSGIFEVAGLKFGVNICRDIWFKEGPTARQAKEGSEFIININASPYYIGRICDREDVVCGQAKDNHVLISYSNLVGGQDELVFDGRSMFVDSSGKIIARGEAFKEDLLMLETGAGAPKGEHKALEPDVEIYGALLLGLKDYVHKNGFSKAVIGLSGGIDSSFVATLAVDALGKDNVTGVYMPTRYSSAESERDAKAISANLGIKFMTIPMDPIFKLYLLVFDSHFSGLGRDKTEENLQARIRGNMLMALSNKFGWMVLATGNKSEMSTGYATLYGDMAGGFAVIKDVPKTMVYRLAKYRNSICEVIPQQVFTKAPTAELRPNQKDQDTLPPYDLLDKILKAYIEEDKTLDEMIAMGFDSDTTKKVVAMVDSSEYKRRQAPPGVKITPKAFGKDRRMPITNKYK
jgi:NAD+ synthase (glutamine-hydrolysing)